MRSVFRRSLYRRPELLFRPLQCFRRLAFAVSRPRGEREVVLPWGPRVTVDPSDRIGASILKTGAYDTAILECLWRLADPGETCLDIGANFGLMASVLARRAGRGGRVVAYEPHPELAGRLRDHAAGWARGLGFSNVEVRQAAVSDRAGESELEIPAEFGENRGTARVLAPGEAAEGGRIAIGCVRLDDEFPDGSPPVGVMKIDIEGHEKAALAGAAGLLGRGAVRDIVFEGHGGYPSEVSKLLESHGYEVFFLRKGLFRPLLLPADTAPEELPNYLATLDPERARRRFAPSGYRVLRAGSDRQQR